MTRSLGKCTGCSARVPLELRGERRGVRKQNHPSRGGTRLLGFSATVANTSLEVKTHSLHLGRALDPPYLLHPKALRQPPLHSHRLRPKRQEWRKGGRKKGSDCPPSINRNRVLSCVLTGPQKGVHDNINVCNTLGPETRPLPTP